MKYSQGNESLRPLGRGRDLQRENQTTNRPTHKTSRSPCTYQVFA